MAFGLAAGGPGEDDIQVCRARLGADARCVAVNIRNTKMSEEDVIKIDQPQELSFEKCKYVYA